ncbi:hypothetical protein [Pseudomonas violetae]|uniref:Uncharacterized protein n=1 Tax=Pseudomonas violetae TaxID=2915813 RepID=A0ABT0ET45_9PSED|nr:hypothetical protein [Pseudomonas violetae]MCK1788918.1 hypothetical protein [Pseudomonas violetae]
MIGELMFQQDGRTYPAYQLDALGNLIRCDGSGPSGGLVPFGIELVSSASEVASPNPWTLTPAKVLERIAFVAPARGDTLEAYPGLQLAQAKFPFVPHLPVIEDEALILQAIEIFPSLSGDDSLAILEQLGANGIFPIPKTATFCAEIHEAAGEGMCIPPIKCLTAGWMSSMKVYRRSLVRSA